MCACASSTKPYHHSNPIRLKDQHHPQIRDSKDLDCNFNFSKDMQNTFSFFECRQKLAERSCKCSSFGHGKPRKQASKRAKANHPKSINAHQCPSMPKGGTCTRRRHCLICLSFKFWCIVWSKSNIHPAIVQDLIDPAEVDGFRRFDAPNWTKQVRIDGKIGQNHPNKVESSIFKPRSSSPSTRNLRKAEV